MTKAYEAALIPKQQTKDQELQAIYREAHARFVTRVTQHVLNVIILLCYAGRAVELPGRENRVDQKRIYNNELLCIASRGDTFMKVQAKPFYREDEYQHMMRGLAEPWHMFDMDMEPAKMEVSMSDGILRISVPKSRD